MHVIFGLLDQPFASLDQLNLSRIHMGVQRVLMLRPDTPAPTLPPDVYTLDVRAPNVIIPNQETTYWCFIQTLPENMPKNHIVKVPVALQMETINMEFIYTHTYTLSRVGCSCSGDNCSLFTRWAKQHKSIIVMVKKAKCPCTTQTHHRGFILVLPEIDLVSMRV